MIWDVGANRIAVGLVRLGPGVGQRRHRAARDGWEPSRPVWCVHGTSDGTRSRTSQIVEARVHDRVVGEAWGEQGRERNGAPKEKDTAGTSPSGAIRRIHANMGTRTNEIKSMERSDELRLAVLIDADNTAAKWADAIFEEIATLGEASVRRIYGDFSGPLLRGWEKKLAGLAVIPNQQFAYTKGKNSSDITLVIDAMDLMHTGRFEGFVLGRSPAPIALRTTSNRWTC